MNKINFSKKFRVNKHRKALSSIIATVLLVLLTIVAIGIVWATINKTIDDKINEGESCTVNLIDKVTLNEKYTCYNWSEDDAQLQELQFSVSIGDVEIDSALITVDANGITHTFNLSNIATDVPYVSKFEDRSPIVTLPGQNSGRTYYFNVTASPLSGRPDSIKINPVVGSNQCEKTDILYEIDDCRALI